MAFDFFKKINKLFSGSSFDKDVVRQETSSTHNIHKNSNVSRNPLKQDVDSSIAAFERGDISGMQNCLFHLVSKLNKPGSGTLIIDYPSKDRLSECFSLCLQYDWMRDSDIREVWAENGFYCIATYLYKDAKTMQDMIAGALDLFLIIYYGKESLKPKVNDILRKASMRARMGIEPEASIFDEQDYQNGADWLLREFSFFAATWVSKIEKQHPQIISSSVRPAYERAKTDYIFATVPYEKIQAKMMFIAKIIGSILEDM